MNEVIIPLGGYCECEFCKDIELKDMCQKIQLWLIKEDDIYEDGSFSESDALLVGVLVMN